MRKMLLCRAGFVVALSLAATGAFAGGWDNNLRTRCASTPTPGQNYYYQDAAQCAGALPNTPHWQLAVESESSLGGSCPGLPNQSYLINGSNSPVQLNWLSHNSDLGPNWSVNLLVDQVNHPLYWACPTPVWTWYAFQNQPRQDWNTPLPKPLDLASSHVINYSHYEQTANDATRLIAGAQFFWNNKAHVIEINLTSTNYNYGAHPPGLLLAKTLADGTEFIILDGPYWGITVTPGVDSFVYIPWKNFVQTAVANHWLSSIVGDSSTGTVELAVEVKDHAIANLWHTNFRIAP